MAEDIKTLKAAIEELTAENANLRKALKSAKSTGVTSIPVAGKFTLDVENAEGKSVKKSVKFKDGRTKVVLIDRNGSKASSECVMKLANGKALSPEELASNPDLKEYSTAEAVALLTHYVSIGAGFLEDA